MTEQTQQVAVVMPRPARSRSRSAGRMFGYTADRAQLVEEEAAAIREAASRVLTGETLSGIVQDWNSRGLTTTNGGPWRVNSLSGLLLHPRLVASPPIIEDDVRAGLLALHASRRKGPRRPPRRYLLTGLLRCWRCGSNLRGTPRPPGADLYMCPGPAHGGCSGTAITADNTENAIRDMVLARLADPGMMGREMGTGKTAQEELAAHRQRLQELGDLWASGEIDREEWLSLKRNVGRRARAAEAELARLARVAAVRELAGTGEALRRQWPGMSIDERRAIVHGALDHVIVLAAEPPRGRFQANRLEPFWVS